MIKAKIRQALADKKGWRVVCIDSADVINRKLQRVPQITILWEKDDVVLEFRKDLKTGSPSFSCYIQGGEWYCSGLMTEVETYNPFHFFSMGWYHDPEMEAIINGLDEYML